MYKNFWYAMALSEEVKDTPFKVKVLSQNFVLYRDSGGVARCMSNVCIHRGGSLAGGRILGDAIACPYHGWEFEPSGQCTKIPSSGKDANPGPRAIVDSYPTQEKAGLIFAFLGDLPEGERPPLMDIPELDDHDWRLTNLSWEIKANYERAVENALDPAHNEFVHPVSGTLGQRDDYYVKKLDPIPADWGVGFMTDFNTQSAEDAGLDRTIKGDTSQAMEVEAGSGFHGPNALWTYLHFGENNQMHQYLWETPVDENTIRAFNLNYRNSMLDDGYDGMINEMNKVVAQQDVDVLEDLEPVLTPDSTAREFMVEADSIIMLYRKALKEWKDKGWAIDVDKVNADKGKVVYAIPSPQRMETKGWVIPAVPCLEGGD